MVLASFIVLTALSGHPASSVPKPKSIELVGKVREVSGGIAGRTTAVIAAESGAEYTMHAISTDAADELRRLAGVRIKIDGLLNDPRLPRGKHVLVQTYEIVDVGKGVVPRLGVIAQLEGRLLFVDDTGRADPLPKGWSKKMTRHVGAKIWMVGAGEGPSFKPLRFSILRPAKKTP